MDVYEQIEAWVSGEMNEADRLDFEVAMQQNPDIREKAITYQILHRQLQNDEAVSSGETALRATLQDVMRNAAPAQVRPLKANARILKLILAVAASVTLIFSLWFLNSKTADPAALYNEYAYFEPLPVSRGNSADSLAGLAVQYFNQQEYAKAIPALQSYLQIHPEAAQYELALGYSFLQTNKNEAAERLFDSQLNSTKPGIADEAQWLKALTLLKKGETEASITNLSKITASSAFYDRARELASKLK